MLCFLECTGKSTCKNIDEQQLNSQGSVSQFRIPKCLRSQKSKIRKKYPKRQNVLSHKFSLLLTFFCFWHFFGFRTFFDFRPFDIRHYATESFLKSKAWTFKKFLKTSFELKVYVNFSILAVLLSPYTLYLAQNLSISVLPTCGHKRQWNSHPIIP